ncbi:MAG: choice-of-anchor D domain-containing protein, partial [Candidatus Cloacimonadaceae bacterium]|nr:choice-of-anchor D domain-containing protein [Candidatus Cloacimonadaceae bacterium]
LVTDNGTGTNRNNLDFSISPGQSRIYNVSFSPAAAINYAENLVISSNATNHSDFNLPLGGSGYIPPSIALDTTELSANLAVGQQSSQSFIISNLGSQELDFSLSYASRANTAGVNNSLSSGFGASPRSIAGSTISLDAYEYNAGSTVDWTFSVHNASVDNEWIQGISLSFPAGVIVNSATSFVGGSNGNMNPDISSGDGITINWFGQNSEGWGVLLPNETALATVNLSIAPSFSGLISLPYQIDGDDYGSEPHSLQGVLDIPSYEPPIQWFSVTPLSGSIPGGGSQEITANFSAIGLDQGLYEAILTIVSNDPVNPLFTMDINLNANIPIEIISPMGGENWQSGTVQSISFNYSGTGTQVSFQYSLNGGSFWFNGGVKNAVQGVNSFNWSIPNTATNNCLIKLTDTVAPNFQAISGVFGIIKPQITIAPVQLSFGTVLIGSNAEQNFTITNSGNAPLSGT